MSSMPEDDHLDGGASGSSSLSIWTTGRMLLITLLLMTLWLRMPEEARWM